jgi:hypothetical protein
MRNWLLSIKGAITCSVIALLSFIAYAFLVSRYLLEELTPGVGLAAVETLIVIAIVGVWVWGLLTAVGGSRGGLIAVFLSNLLPALFTLYDLLFYSPSPYGWPLLQIVIWTTFISNVIALAAVAFQLRQKQAESQAFSD